MRSGNLRNSLVLIPMFILGCGGDGGPTIPIDQYSQVAYVTDVRVDPEIVRVGEEIAIQVDFEPSQNTTDYSDGDSDESLKDSTVVLRIPPGIDYVTDSSDFDGSDVHGFRERGPNHVEICADGTRVLTYLFSKGELTDNENKIRLSAIAYEAHGSLAFEAEASSFISSPCNIVAEDFDVIIVNP